MPNARRPDTHEHYLDAISPFGLRYTECVIPLMVGLVLASQSSSFQAYVEEAERRIEAGQLAEAVEPLTNAHALDPGSLDVLWKLALAHRELGSFQDGLRFAEGFVEHAPDDISGRLMLASYLDVLGQRDAAADAYEQVLSRDATDPRALYGLALVEMGRGQDARAMELFEKILANYPGDARALVPLGALYAQSGRSGEALAALSRAVRSAPSSYEARHYLGSLYSTLGRYELALQNLQHALELRPDDPATLFEIGLVHARQEALTEAKSFFEQSLAGRADHAETHFRLAGIAEYEKSIEEAEMYYQRALELDATYAPAHYQLGRLYAGASRAADAEKPLLRALELDPDLADAYHELARVYDALDRPDDARLYFEKAVAQAPFAPEPRLNFGNFLQRNEDREEARRQLEAFRELKAVDDRLKELKAAVNFDPTNAPSKRALIEHLLENDRDEEALDESLRFVALASMEPLHHVLLAKVHEARGDKEEAIAVLESAADMLSGAPDIERELERLRTESQ